MVKAKVQWSRFTGWDPAVIAPLLNKFLENIKNTPVTTFEVPKEQWEKLSPVVKEMIRKGQMSYIISTAEV